jgi:hypothetical protein
MIPFVTIELDKPRRLRFGMAAMVEFEQLTGKKLLELDDDLSFETTAQALWVMLRQDEPELTFAEACALVDEHAGSLTDVLKAVTRAIFAAISSKKKSKNVATPTAPKNS